MAVPERLGRYEVLDRLGGHSCPVYRARDTRVGRLVALKILPADADSEQRERLLAEARAGGTLRHPNLIQVLDFGEEAGCLYLAMELVDGRTLREELDGRPPKSLVWKLRIACEIADVLAYIHEHRIIHRDIKPDNIFIDRDQRVRLMDFGVAKFEGLQLTAAGFTLGTPGYMAPEQIRGEPLTHLIDVYAFGVTLFEMFAGIRPFQGASLPDLFDSILKSEPNAEPLRSAGVPEPVIELVESCIKKDPSLRPQSFREIMRLL